MIPTDDDIKAIRESIEATAGMDKELRDRCGQLIRIGDFNSAVREAFTVLEEPKLMPLGLTKKTVPLADTWPKISVATLPITLFSTAESVAGWIK